MVEEKGQPTQQTTVPEQNKLDQYLVKKFYYGIGAVTRPSVSRKNGDEIERS